MDGKRFDALTLRLASIRLTRGSALRGMGAGALALTGLAKVTEEASAGKKRKYCECTSPSDTCETRKVGRRARKQALQSQPCSYKGECRGSGDHNPCQAGASITVNVNDINLIGIDCENDSDCGGSGSGLGCLNIVGLLGVCLPLVGGAPGDNCNEDSDCATGRCENDECVECDTLDICGNDDNAQCCFVDAECLGGLCLFP